MSRVLSVSWLEDLTDPASWSSNWDMEITPTNMVNVVRSPEAVPFCKICNNPLAAAPPGARGAVVDGKQVLGVKFGHLDLAGCVEGPPTARRPALFMDDLNVGWREPPAPPPDPMKDAIKKKLHDLIDAPDFGSKSLATLIKVARSAREMLMAEQTGSRWRRQVRQPGMIYPGGMGMLDPDGLDDDGPANQIIGGDSGGYIGSPLAPSSFQETFGANIIREAIAAMPKLLQKPERTSDLVDALAAAKVNDLPEVVALIASKIRERLGTMEPELPKDVEPVVVEQGPSVEPTYYAMVPGTFPGGA